MTSSSTLRLGAPSPSVMRASSAFMAALYSVLWGGREARRHIGAGQLRAMDRARPILPPTPLNVAGASRQVRRQRLRLAHKGRPL